MSVAVSEIAKHSGVSKGLVSRLLRDDPTLRISSERKKHILAVRDRLVRESQELEQVGVREPRRRRLSRHFILPCVGHRVFDVVKAHLKISFFDGFQSILDKHGFRLSLTLIDESKGVGEIESIVTSKGYCDGMLLVAGATGPFDKQQVADIILSKKFPHVCYDTSMEKHGLASVYSNSDGMVNALEDLKALGHSRIAYVGTKGLCYRMYCAAMGLNIMNIDPELDCLVLRPDQAVPSTEEGWRDVSRENIAVWLDNRPDATAIVCQNDHVAMGVLDAMEDRGLTPGKDISVVGYGNIEQREAFKSDNPLLSTVDVDSADIGCRCGELLMDQVLFGQMRIVHEHVPSRYVSRQTTGPVSGGQG